MPSTTTINLSPAQQRVQRQVSGPKFSMYLLKNLPMGWIAGMRVRELTPERCVTSVPFKWLTKNPFQSIYFAVQSMAAELSTAANCMLAITGQDPSVAFIIVGLEAKFSKKATDRVYFTCEDGYKAYEAVNACIETGESHSATFETVGRMADGTEVARFKFTWSFKQRRTK